MLPQWLFNPATNTSYDVSALGSSSARTSPQQLPGWCHTGTDAMHRGHVEVAEEHPPSLPVRKGAPNPLGTYRRELTTGLREFLVCATRPAPQKTLLKALQRFQGVTRRVVCRATRIYGGLSAQSLRPEVLTHRLLHDFRLEQLSHAALLSPRPGNTWQLFEQELKALECLDVPLFAHQLGSRDLPLDSDTVLNEFFAEDGIVGAQRRIEGLTLAEIEWQCAIVSASLRCRQTTMTLPTQPLSEGAPAAPAPGAQHVSGSTNNERRSLWLGASCEAA